MTFAGLYRLKNWFFHQGKNHPPGTELSLSHEDGATATQHGTAVRVEAPAASEPTPESVVSVQVATVDPPAVITKVAEQPNRRK